MSTTPASPPPVDDPEANWRTTWRMPWTVGITALIAVLMYHLAAGFHLLTAVFVFALLASYVVPVKLTGESPLRWWLRLALVVIILMLNQGDPGYGEGVGSMRLRNVFGQLYMAEMTLQFWRWRPQDPNRSSVIALSASGLLVTVGSNTFEDRFVRVLTPLYIATFGLSLLHYRDRLMSRKTWLLRGVALTAALVLGLFGYLTVQANRERLNDLNNRLLSNSFSVRETGMVSQPQLGPLFGLRGSPARVLLIQNFVGDPHLRGMAFDRYQNGAWFPAFRDRTFRAVGENLSPEGADRILGSELVTITRLDGSNPLIYAPLNVATIDPNEADDVEWSPEFGGPIRLRARTPHDYLLTVPPSETYQGILANPLFPAVRERSLLLPERLDPRIAQLAQRITADARTDRDKIAAVTNYLLSNHSYSLEFRPGNREPLEDFLLSEPKKAAHCEFFGSAAAVLLRYVGVPTRYVTGYYAHEKAEGESNRLVVRQRDAHAWCEAWVEGIGWVTVDATPGDGRPDALATEVEWWRRIMERVQDAYKVFTDWLGDRTPEEINLGLGILLSGGVLYGLFVFLQFRRRRGPAPVEREYAGGAAEVAALAKRFEAVFARKGYAVPPDKTYGEHLDTLAADPPEDLRQTDLLDNARRFVGYYNRARWGQQAAETDLRTLEDSVQEMEKAAK
ncbi:MAG: hypothetical protein OHK0029_01500 [Armatimonadaceae bacterium]